MERSLDARSHFRDYESYREYYIDPTITELELQELIEYMKYLGFEVIEERRTNMLLTIKVKSIKVN